MIQMGFHKWVSKKSLFRHSERRFCEAKNLPLKVKVISLSLDMVNNRAFRTAPAMTLILTLTILFCVPASSQTTKAPFKRLKTKHGYIVPLPLIVYSPETHFGLGLSGQYLFRFKNDSLSNLSTTGSTILYTLEKQFIVNPNWDFYFRENKWRTGGALVYQKFPESFWGIGNSTGNEEKEKFTAKYILFRNRATRQMAKHFHLGLQYRVEYAYDFKTDTAGVLHDNAIRGSSGYRQSGAGVAAVYDSRDNSMFPFKGWLVVFSNHFYPRWLGSEYEFANFKVDARKYFNPFTSNVIAVQALLSFHAGEPPFKMLSLLGGTETMRGYYMGRYRDKHLFAAQAEWRFPIWWRFVGAAFYGVGDVTRNFKDLSWGSLKHSIGGGLRFTLDSSERINVRFDAAFGTDGSRGFYFQVGEAF